MEIFGMSAKQKNDQKLLLKACSECGTKAPENSVFRAPCSLAYSNSTNLPPGLPTQVGLASRPRRARSPARRRYALTMPDPPGASGSQPRSPRAKPRTPRCLRRLQNARAGANRRGIARWRGGSEPVDRRQSQVNRANRPHPNIAPPALPKLALACAPLGGHINSPPPPLCSRARRAARATPHTMAA